MERLPLPTRHVIEVLGFVPADTVDPISYQRAYYARPADFTSERPYEVLVSADLHHVHPGDHGWPLREDHSPW
ncbi:Ku protein [Streptomyces sp. NPDC001221]